MLHFVALAGNDYEAVTRAEILWCLNASFLGLSLRDASKTARLLKTMSPNDPILASMQLGKDKVAYTIVQGISPVFQKRLRAEISMSPFFVACFDESLNSVATRTNGCAYTVLERKYRHDPILRFRVFNSRKGNGLARRFQESTMWIDDDISNSSRHGWPECKFISIVEHQLGALERQSTEPH